MKIKITLAILASLMLSGCYSYKSTLSTHVISTEKLKTPTKVGKACSDENKHEFPISILFNDVDITVEKARQNAGITEVISVENEYSGHLFSHRRCILVRGN